MNEDHFPKMDRTVFSVVSSFEEADRADREYWLSRTHTNACNTWSYCGELIMALTLPPDCKEFLKLLKEHDVRYLLIEGYAVGYHGYARATEDMDIWVAVHPDNAEKLVAAL